MKTTQTTKPGSRDAAALRRGLLIVHTPDLGTRRARDTLGVRAVLVACSCAGVVAHGAWQALVFALPLLVAYLAAETLVLFHRRQVLGELSRMGEAPALALVARPLKISSVTPEAPGGQLRQKRCA